MVRLFVISFLLSISLSCFSQSAADSLLGTWQVIKITPLPTDARVKNKVNEIFLHSTFTFKAGHTLKFVTKATKTGEVAELLDMLNDKFWVNETGNSIFLGDKKDNYPGGEIRVTQKDNKTYFTLPESPFTFEVIKQFKADLKYKQ